MAFWKRPGTSLARFAAIPKISRSAIVATIRTIQIRSI